MARHRLDDITKELLSEHDELLLADGFDGALVGIVRQFNKWMACYDLGLCERELRKDGMTRDEAKEYLEFNVLGAYVGENGPCFLYYHRNNP